MRPISAVSDMVRMGYLNVVPVGLVRPLITRVSLPEAASANSSHAVEKHQIKKTGLVAAAYSVWQTTARGRFVLIDDNGYGRAAF